VIARHVRRQMEASRLPLLASELCNRVSYAEAALIGATPTVTEPAGPAAREVARLAREIEAFYPSAFAGLGGRHAQDVV
jgi:chromosome partitioning protein